MHASGTGRTRRVGATVCLPAALASLLMGMLPLPCPAAARLDVREQIQSLSGSSTLTLNLMNGQTVSGVFRNFVGDWSDSVQTSVRYAAWRASQSQALPALGDAILVVLTSGDSLRGSFKGVGATFLALDIGNIRFDAPITYASIGSVRDTTGTPIGDWSVLRRLLQEAPMLTSVILRLDAEDMLVTREAISTVTGAHAAAAKSGISGGDALIIVGIVALAGVLICAASVNSASNDLSSCTLVDIFGLGSVNSRFGSSTVSTGLAPWASGETRRP